MNKNTEKLAQAAWLGDKQALSQLLIICQPDIKRFARRVCSTTEDIEDAVQIALWQLHNKIGTLKKITSFASWLFRIVERECYRLFKDRAALKSSKSEFKLDSLATPSHNIDLHIDLANAILHLPFIYRKVVILRDIEEFTAPEVAEKLGITMEAVKSRLHRGRTMLRKELNSKDFANN